MSEMRRGCVKADNRSESAGAAAVKVMRETSPPESASVHAVPARRLERGFRLLTLREFRNIGEPSAFAFIEQRLLRAPQRPGRHGLFFANTFLPEIMAWLNQQLGRPSVRADTGQVHRNGRWPAMTWHGEDRAWPDGARTVEWFADVTFPEQASWTAFQRQWHARLMGEEDETVSMAKHDGAFAGVRAQEASL